MTEVTILAYGIENKHSSEVATARRYSGKDLGGRGVLKWADGPYYWYRGQFNADNLAHGYGAKEGYLYTAAGQWADGRMDGPCVLRYASGRTCYRLYERGVNVNCAWEWEDKESHAVTCKFDDLPCDASDVRLIHIKTAALQVEVKVLLVTAEIDSAYKAACGSAPPEQPDYSTFSKPEKKSGCSVS